MGVANALEALYRHLKLLLLTLSPSHEFELESDRAGRAAELRVSSLYVYSSVFLPLCYFLNLSVFFQIPFLFFFPVSHFLSSLGRKLQLLSIVRFCWHMVQI